MISLKFWLRRLSTARAPRPPGSQVERPARRQLSPLSVVQRGTHPCAMSCMSVELAPLRACYQPRARARRGAGHAPRLVVRRLHDLALELAHVHHHVLRLRASSSARAPPTHPARADLVVHRLDVVQRHLRERAREALEPVHCAAFVRGGVRVEYSEPARAEDAAEGEGSGGPGCSVRLPNRDAASCPRFTRGRSTSLVLAAL
jgi:hypothetical protein